MIILKKKMFFYRFLTTNSYLPLHSCTKYDLVINVPLPYHNAKLNSIVPFESIYSLQKT